MIATDQKMKRWLLTCRRCKRVAAVEIPEKSYLWTSRLMPERCPACSLERRGGFWWCTVTVVKGHYSADHPCDSRCMNARGPNCDCSCGGANHGRAHLIT